MNIVFVGKMPADGYSGGRYHGWIMAEALAEMSHKVYFVTNNEPMFRADFKSYPKDDTIQLIPWQGYQAALRDVRHIDFVILILDFDMTDSFCEACVEFAAEKQAKFVFINFESPNWYNCYASQKRPEQRYLKLSEICKQGCLVISSAYESQKYAKEYYNAYPESTHFAVWSPPINSVVADSVQCERGNKALVFVRVKDKHKGSMDILHLLDEPMRGWTITLVVGNGVVPEKFMEEVQERAGKYGITVEIKYQLTDAEKFYEMKSAKVLVFPSYFEGYGYPPIEALYCGTSCVAYDLPVLREISGEHIHYCEWGNADALCQKVFEVAIKDEQLEERFGKTADFYEQAKQLNELLTDMAKEPWCTKKMSSGGWLSCILKRMRRKSSQNGGMSVVAGGREVSRILQKEEETWNKVHKKIKGCQIYIWGYGELCKTLLPKYARKVKVQNIIDKKQKLQGTVANGTDIEIVSPDILNDVDKKNTAVLIATINYVDEIIEELREKGIDNVHSLYMIEAQK